MASIIFFAWIALTPHSDYKLIAEDIAYYTEKCNKVEGRIQFVRATPRTYRFKFGEIKVKKWLWSGYDVYCFKIEKK